MKGMQAEKKMPMNRGGVLFLLPLSLFVLFVSLAGPRQAEAVTAPSKLTATPVSSSQIDLTWIDATGEAGYRVERTTDPKSIPFSVIATVGANVTSYSDTGLAASTTYYYRITAYDAKGSQASSGIASATTSPLYPPAAPSDLDAVTISISQINLTWTDNAGDETGFKIERTTDPKYGTYAVIASVGANSTSYSDTGLAPSTSYTYRVRAYNADGYSAYSNTAWAVTIVKTITATASPGGTISPSGSVIVGFRSDQAFTITADSGYQIADVLVDNESVGAVSTHTFTNVTADHTITASFADITPPTGSIIINNDEAATNVTSVTLLLSATDSGGVAQMQFSNDGTTWSTPEPYATTKSWTLAPGDGTKTVYVKFKDSAENWSVPYSDTIILDTVLDSVSIDPATTPTNTDSQTITGIMESGATMTVSVSTTAAPSAVTYPTVTTWSCTITGLVEGDNTITATATDAAGNTASTEATVTLDTVSPAISIDPATTPTNTDSQTITGIMESGATVALSVNTTAAPGAVTYPTATTWSCSITGLAEGANDITVTATDTAGNSAVGTASIIYYNLSISNVSIGRHTIDTSASESSTIFFTLNGPATVTLKIVPEAEGPTGTPVFQVSQAAATAGAYSFTWDGKNNAGSVVSDEAYLYILEVTDGIASDNYSPAPPTGTGTVSCTQGASYDPYKNEPLTIDYSLTQPGRVDLSITWEGQQFKIMDGVPHMSGSYTHDWDGRNLQGHILTPGSTVDCSVAALLRENYIITTGDTPKTTQVKTDPYYLHLAYGQFTRIKYALSREADVTVNVISPSGSHITLISSQRKIAGAHEFEWNGLDVADSTGKQFLVSQEGTYTISIKAVNPATGSSAIAKGSLKIAY